MRYDRKITSATACPHTPHGLPAYTGRIHDTPAIWAASRQLHAYRPALRAIRNGMSSRSQEAGA
ncbi:hypothetical protein CNQ36_17090 [Streptomyces fungicidicus]|uniref:Uncharacterized protein n=1 Tax=Streptomyces fungicidicus TaxID=68203 RepID=A0A494UQ39_9ACTN|nr:hypothetical protein CNQ36_17090 [Streptomyces fungicidicus]